MPTLSRLNVLGSGGNFLSRKLRTLPLIKSSFLYPSIKIVGNAVYRFTSTQVNVSFDSTSNSQILEPAQYALLHRMGIHDKVDPFLARCAMDHISFIPGSPLAAKFEDRFNGLLFIGIFFTKNNFIGASSIKYFVTEFLNIRFPKLSVSDTTNAIAIMTDSPILDAIITKFSLDRALVCLDPSIASGEPSGDFIANAARKSFLALLGAIVVSTKVTLFFSLPI